MTLDAIAGESHFFQHLAPVWKGLPALVRGRFLVAPDLIERARSQDIDAEVIDADALRRTPQQGPVHDGIPTLVASIGDIKLGRRIGHGPFAFLEHGAGQGYDGRNASMASYAGGPDRADNDLFLVPNEYSAARWRASYPNAQVAIVGCPKLDGLPRRQGDGPPTVALSFHGDWPSGVPYGGNALADYANSLPAVAAAFRVIGHAHPRFLHAEAMRRLYWRYGIPYVREFEDVCRQADVYVCDNSSTIFEFAATGRPVVLLNARHWSRKSGPGLRFWDAAHVGINVDRADQLIPAIEEALYRDSRQADREDALSIVYGVRSGGADIAARAITDWLASKVSVAA